MYLNCKTWFSFRYGTFSTEALVQAAADAGAPALALTNINSTCDSWDFYEYCMHAGIRPVLGTEIRNGDDFCYILLAQDLEGFAAINLFLSVHLQQAVPFPEKPLFPGKVWVIYPPGKYPVDTLTAHELIGVQPSQLNRLYGTTPGAWPDKYVIWQPVTYPDKAGYNLHRLLRAVDKNILLSKQQPGEIAGLGEHFVSPAALLQAFRSYPAMVTATLKVMDSCNLRMDLNTDKNKACFTGSRADDRVLLEKLVTDGMYHRYGNHPEAAVRVQKELKIINDLGFNAYFLITWDIIRYAQSRGFFYVGRGSGANSIAAYCLRITDVDPIELDLYFERFLNPYRTSPPDFDIDFSWKDRDEVIDYVFKRYGRDHVALLGMYSTFQRSAIIRELGKVFGLPKAEIDALVDNPRALLGEDRFQKQILRYGKLLENFPNHLSIHPGGMLISEKPIYTYTTLELPPKGFATTQIDMFLAEKVGLYKLDILSQRGLGHIRDCIHLVEANKGVRVDIHDVEKFKGDEHLAARIRDADSIGCFYIESPAMRQLLKKLRCGDYLTLVAASSIIRPGVARSGMMRQYIFRFHHPDQFEYLHPKMEDLLKETYGVMVYQEDVIKVAHYFAGLDMGEADILRRAMSGKYRSNNRFLQIREKFFANCRLLGYPDQIVQEVWRQMESFGGYSFSKAHSASFAVESYQSLYLKTYHPMEFMVSVINNFGGFYYTELYFHELKRTGATVVAPCVNQGEYLTSIQGSLVHTGLIHVQGLSQAVAEGILEERIKRGPFLHLQDLIERTAVPGEQLNILIRVGALRFTGKNKKELLWEANFLEKKNKFPVAPLSVLFREQPREFRLPPLTLHPLDDALDEIALLGFPLCNVWDLVNTDITPFLTAADLPAQLGHTIRTIGYYVTTKWVRTVKGELMSFGTFLDKQGNWLDTVHFPDSSEQYPLQGRGFYILQGKVVEEFGVYSLEVGWCSKVGIRER
ncbi:MAG TPA: DNA polymerase III subunit alpha [Chitinophagaceae bacterium]|nr:DNA polymerase III subunit alpha [Chitinophagaceae bacterium]